MLNIQILLFIYILNLELDIFFLNLEMDINI